jgi:AraC-like DNA-binding protein
MISTGNASSDDQRTTQANRSKCRKAGVESFLFVISSPIGAQDREYHRAMLEVPCRNYNPASTFLRELGHDPSLVDEMLPATTYHELSSDEQRDRVTTTLRYLIESFDLRPLPVLLAARPYSLPNSIMKVAALAAPSLGEAFIRIARYEPIWERCVSTGVTPRSRRGHIRIEVESGGNSEDVGVQALREGVIASTLSYARVLSPNPMRPRRVYFEHAAPRDRELFAKFFEAPIEYEAETNAIEFDADVLATPTRLPDPVISEIAVGYLESLERLVSEHLRSASVRTRVAIKNGLHERMPTCGQVARRLGMSERTLRRRLQESGTSFENLGDTVRRNRASELLALTDRPLTDIAFALGFASSSAFSRAFRRWFGLRPSKYRMLRAPAR